MKKFIPIALIVLVAVGVGIVLLGSQKADNLPADGWKEYEGSGYTVSYPADYTVDASYVHDIAPGKQSSGVRFVVDAKTASGTNLSTDSSVSVETIPTLSACNPSAYLDGINPAEMLVEDGKAYAVASSSGAGAGNFYEEIVYIRVDNPGICPAVRYLIHTTNLANYPEGTVTAYNRAALLEEFDKIRRSLQTK